MAAENLKRALARHLAEIGRLPVETLLGARYERYRALGVIEENVATPAIQPLTTA
ncbi:hypothetical protein D3C83_107070 [compost metagenome]